MKTAMMDLLMERVAMTIVLVSIVVSLALEATAQVPQYALLFAETESFTLQKHVMMEAKTVKGAIILVMELLMGSTVLLYHQTLFQLAPQYAVMV